MGRLVFGIAFVVMWCGCSPYSSNGTFNCNSDTQCSGGPGAGQCVAGFCAFADGTCASGQRYGDLAGGMSGQCVGANNPDARMPDGDNSPDAKVFMDAMVSGTTCYGANNDPAQECFPTIVAGTTAQLTGTIDTSMSATCLSGVSNTNLCVIAADTITTTGGTVKVIGPKPLVVIGATSIVINSVIDLASHSGKAPGFNMAQTGAGAELANDTTNCKPGTPPGTSGGGAGGAFGTTAGNGGSGNGGATGMAVTPAALRGGCFGQNGNQGTFGVGGAGGGALALISNATNGTITIMHDIDASGAGGTGGAQGSPQSGGGGGGTGGMLVFDAATITNMANIYANGGGGGASSSDGGGTGGKPGGEANNTNAAPGGGPSGGSSSSPGGAGGAKGATPANGTNANGVAGGGGGGSVGVIKEFTGTITGGQVSPSPS